MFIRLTHPGQSNFPVGDSYLEDIAFQEPRLRQPTPRHPDKRHPGLSRKATLVRPADLDRRRLGLRQWLLEKFRSKNSSFHPNTYNRAPRSEDSVLAMAPPFSRGVRPVSEPLLSNCPPEYENPRFGREEALPKPTAIPPASLPSGATAAGDPSAVFSLPSRRKACHTPGMIPQKPSTQKSNS